MSDLRRVERAIDAAATRLDALCARADAFNASTVLKEHGPKIAAQLGKDRAAKSMLGEHNSSPEHALNLFAQHDPTGNKKAYTPWIAREYGRGNIRSVEDLPRVHDTLDLHQRHKAKLPVEQRDVGKHTFQSLTETTKPFRALAPKARTVSTSCVGVVRRPVSVLIVTGKTTSTATSRCTGYTKRRITSFSLYWATSTNNNRIRFSSYNSTST